MKSTFKKILLIFFILLTIFNTFITVTSIILWNETKLDDLSKLYPKNNTRIYDLDGNMIANLSTIYTSYASYETIPKDMIDAVICIEDSRFFSHKGIDYEAILRSILTNIKEGEYSQGASTITQQLIKNVYLTNEKSIERKVKEIILALKLENILTKEDILASYLSNVLFGGRIYGVKMAAKYYFNKELSDIELKEAALLAGLLQMPNYYNPFNNYLEAVKRRDLVLRLMYENNYIDQETYNITKNIELSSYLNKGQINENIGIYASYIDYVTNEAITKYDIDFSSKNLDITINVDSKMQKLVYDVMQNKFNHFPDDKLRCGIVLLDNKTAKILAIGGSRESGMKNLNYATEVYNQPASTIKPILSYAPAIENLNYLPLTQILDDPYYYPDGMKVNNWDNRYLGNISLRYALSNSRNVPAIKLYKLLGDELAWDMANKLGLSMKDDFYHESMAIGGFQKGYSVLEMTNSYIAFSNKGKFKNAFAIDNIKTNNLTYENQDDFKQVMSEETAFLITDILHDVLKNTKYDLKDKYLASKTGQSNYDYNTRIKYNIPANSTKDSWIIAYTPELTIGIWCGYDNLNKGLYLTPKTKDIPIYIMKYILDEISLKGSTYSVPSNLNLVSVDIVNGLLYEVSKYSKNVKKDYFYKGFTPLLRENLDLDIV